EPDAGPELAEPSDARVDRHGNADLALRRVDVEELGNAETLRRLAHDVGLCGTTPGPAEDAPDLVERRRRKIELRHRGSGRLWIVRIPRPDRVRFERRCDELPQRGRGER